MCYSAQVWQRYREYVKRFGAEIDINEFVRRYGARIEGAKERIPLGLDKEFLADPAPAVAPIQALIRDWNAAETQRLERELFSQRRRVAEAERSLLARETKKAREDVRIGTTKGDAARRRLEDLRRTEPKARDSRIFPGWFTPVLVVQDGKRVLVPMRYQCRPAGKPSHYDRRYPGTYNARRDNLEGFWDGQFGHTHAIMIAERFYENVEAADGSNRVLEFTPADGEPMLVACLWSRWTDPKGKEPDLLSFAAITDEPPPEVAEAGHDRCIVPLKPEHLDVWLQPEGRPLDELYAILDDRHRPYYEHRQAA